MKIFPILILLLISCGYKTPPKPYPSVSEDLMKVQKEKIYFDDNQLVLEWHPPDKLTLINNQVSNTEKEDNFDILLYQLKIFTPSDCLACEDQLIAKIDFPGNNFSPEINPQGLVFQKNNQNRYRLLIPGKHLIEFDQYPLIYFRIDYYTSDGDLSPGSKKLYPKKPVTIPVPEINWKIVTTNAAPKEIKTETERSDLQYITNKDTHLLINWKPPLEKEVHEIADNNTLKIINKYYGLVLFSFNANHEIELISPKPLYNGQFLILEINRQIWAKYQDRFGNFSNKILVYKP